MGRTAMRYAKLSSLFLTVLMLSSPLLTAAENSVQGPTEQVLGAAAYPMAISLPSAPQNITAKGGNHVIHLAWNKSANEGGDGSLVVNITASANDMAQDAQFLYVAATAWKNDGAGLYEEYRMEKRYKSNGTLVPGFGTGGVISENPTVGANDEMRAITVDGTFLYVCGNTNWDGSHDSAWRVEKRYKSNGSLNASFGTNGIISENPSSGLHGADDTSNLMVSGEYLIIGGWDRFAGGFDSSWRIEKRYTSNGSFVTDFGSSGVYRWNPSGQDFLSSFALDANWIYAVGNYDSAGAIKWAIQKVNITSGVASWSNFIGYYYGVTSIAIDNYNMYIVGRQGSGSGSGDNWRMEKRKLSDSNLVTGFGTSGTLDGPGGNHFDTEIIVNGTNLYVVGDPWKIERRSNTTGAIINNTTLSPYPSGGTVDYAVCFDGTYLYLAGYDTYVTTGEERFEKVHNGTLGFDTKFGAAVSNYKIYKGNSSGSEAFLAQLGLNQTYNDTNVTNGKKYYYTLSAVNQKGESVHTAEVSAIPYTVPGAPTNLVANGMEGMVDLTWNQPASNGGSPVTNFTIYRGLSSGSKVAIKTVGNVTVFSDMAVSTGTTYFYKVCAKNLAGAGANSTEASGTTADVPSAVQGLTAQLGNANVTLTWSAPATDGNSTVLNYTVYRGTATGTESYLVTLGQVLTFKDTGLTNGQAYYYTVNAMNLVGFGPNSTEAHATPMTVPSEPRNLTAYSGDTNITLTWLAPASNGGSAILNYTVYRGASSGTETKLATLGNVLTFKDTGLTNGQIYYYTVYAKNSIGTGMNSTEVVETPMTVPSAPLTVTTAPGSTNITLSWAAPASNGGSAILNYTVYRGTSAGTETKLVTLGTVLTYKDTGLTNGVKYFYKVNAMNSAGFGANSTEVNATPRTVPTAPQTLTATAGNTNVTLSWAAPASDGGSAISNYTIYRGTSSGIETSLATLGNVLTYKDTGLTNGQKYYYVVKALNIAGTGPASNEANATPVSPISAPTAPLTLTATAGDKQVVLTWTAPSSNGGSAVLNYTVYRGTTTGTETLLTTLGNVLTYTDKGLTNGQKYYYTVSAKNLAGEGAKSAEGSATPVSSVPPTPSAPQTLVLAAGNGNIKLTWSPPASAGSSAVTGYNIYRGTAQGNEVKIGQVGNVLTYTDKNVTSGTVYYYKVTAKNTAGESPASTEPSLKAPSKTNSGGWMSSYWPILLLLLLLLVLAIIIFAVATRRKDDEDEKEDEDEEEVDEEE